MLDLGGDSSASGGSGGEGDEGGDASAFAGFGGSCVRATGGGAGAGASQSSHRRTPATLVQLQYVHSQSPACEGIAPA